MENRLAVKRSFSRAILLSKALSKEKEDLMVVFMLSNIKDIFKVGGMQAQYIILLLRQALTTLSHNATEQQFS